MSDEQANVSGIKEAKDLTTVKGQKDVSQEAEKHAGGEYLSNDGSWKPCMILGYQDKLPQYVAIRSQGVKHYVPPINVKSVTVSATGVSPKESVSGGADRLNSDQGRCEPKNKARSVSPSPAPSAALELEEWTRRDCYVNISIFHNVAVFYVDSAQAICDAHNSVVLQAKKEIEGCRIGLKQLAEQSVWLREENGKLSAHLATAKAALEKIGSSEGTEITSGEMRLLARWTLAQLPGGTNANTGA